jgi:hydrogenase/urease accessory protein HupE
MATTPAQAHESRPVYLEIIETQNNTYRMSWKIPPSVLSANLPNIQLPESCTIEGNSGGSEIRPDGYEGRRLVRCLEGLPGAQIAIRFPVFNPSVSIMLKLRTASGEEHWGLLGPQAAIWHVPARETDSGVARQYTLTGIEHIWQGWDHLLFLVCLLWIAGSLRRILLTITGFTLAHSATLALSALNIVRLPVPPIEAAIALSVAFLAREIAIGRRASLTWQHPITVASSFGLLHGLGFAAVLQQIGLPQTRLLTGLVFFNVGVELGQVVFVLTAIGVLAALRLLQARLLPTAVVAKMAHWKTSAQLGGSYLVGIIASYWLIERVTGFA